MTFGQMFKQKRIEQRLTLRNFCIKHSFDPGYISKLERGRIKPIEDLTQYKEALQLNDDDWQSFQDLAAEVDPQPLTDAELARKLPLFLPGNVTEDKLRELANLIADS